VKPRATARGFAVSWAGVDNRGVGFNPFRQQKRRSSDYVLVAAAVAITLLLVLWALIPR
jgi:hypothetical protein